VTIAVFLSVLCQQNQRRRVCRLHREHEIQQDEWVWVPAQRDGQHIDRNPDKDEKRLHDEKSGSAKIPGNALRKASERTSLV